MRSGGFSGLGIAILEGRGWGEVGRVEFLIKVSFVMGESDCGGSTRVGRLGHCRGESEPALLFGLSLRRRCAARVLGGGQRS